eukprot:TRINITY_DN8009_c0_g1_i1.p1 TRINITY_DN8009_c0_g1~~TRINITY_DN8009_c0_g1_i1.p1  ORF type:complete len:557 (+),score=83.73 TRINITY_DN8009_c0_g1_i1:19-1689(+)
MGCTASVNYQEKLANPRQDSVLVVRPDGAVRSEDVRLVQESFAHLSDMQRLGEAFYNELFQSNPQVKCLFFSDPTKQAERLMAMISIAVQKLNDQASLIPALQQLARRHLQYGVTALHYPLVGEALIKVLGDTLGSGMTSQIKDAWLRVYGLISSVMLDAAKSAQQQQQDTADFVVNFHKEELLWAMTNCQGIITQCSKRWCESLGYAEKQLVGRSICTLQPTFVSALHDSYIQRYLKHVAPPGKSGTHRPSGCPALGSMEPISTHPREVSLASASGSPKMYNLSVSPNGDGFLAIFEDRTAHRELEQQRDRLLQEVLPARISQQLLENPKAVIANKYEKCSVLFCDVVGFTSLSSTLDSQLLLRHLNQYYSALDDLLRVFQLLKVKTIGDAYMCAAGLPDVCDGDEISIACFALQMLHVLRTQLQPSGVPFRTRVGIHYGEVSGGVVGNTRPQFDLFGDTVNTASRMESSGAAMQIQISEKFAATIGEAFVTEPRGEIPVKGKGTMSTRWLTGYASAPNVRLETGLAAKASTLLQGFPFAPARSSQVEIVHGQSD